MDLASSGESMAVVVQLKQAADGQWCLYVDGTRASGGIPLTPMTLIVNVWLAGDARLLRGSLQLYGTQHAAPLQSNGQLIDLVQAWLLGEKADGTRVAKP